MSERPAPCYACGEPSVVLCDGILAGESGRPLGEAEDYRRSNLVGCDRPACAQHARRVGHIRFGGRRGGDSIDHCLECHAGGGKRIAAEHELPRRQGSLFD